MCSWLKQSCKLQFQENLWKNIEWNSLASFSKGCCRIRDTYMSCYSHRQILHRPVPLQWLIILCVITRCNGSPTGGPIPKAILDSRSPDLITCLKNDAMRVWCFVYCNQKLYGTQLASINWKHLKTGAAKGGSEADDCTGRGCLTENLTGSP